MIRLRQVALVAVDRDRVVDELCEWLGVTVSFEDPGVAEFGLHNALMTIGDQFLEVVSPVTEGTTAGRLLDKRGGDGGYMAIFEVDDLDARSERLTELGVRVVWRIDLDRGETIAIVQAADVAFAHGERVKVLRRGDGAARVAKL